MSYIFCPHAQYFVSVVILIMVRCLIRFSWDISHDLLRPLADFDGDGQCPLPHDMFIR